MSRRTTPRRTRPRPPRRRPLRPPHNRPADPPPSTAPASSAPVGDGSGNAAQQGTVTYAGSVDGGAASLAIVVNNGKAIAYVCDGKKVEAWLNGTMANGQIDLTGAAGEPEGHLRRRPGQGQRHRRRQVVGLHGQDRGPPSGLYRSAASLRNKLDAGWVVLPDGRQVGVQKKNGETQRGAAVRREQQDRHGRRDAVPIEAGNPNASSGY